MTAMMIIVVFALVALWAGLGALHRVIQIVLSEGRTHLRRIEELEHRCEYLSRRVHVLEFEASNGTR